MHIEQKTSVAFDNPYSKMSSANSQNCLHGFSETGSIGNQANSKLAAVVICKTCDTLYQPNGSENSYSWNCDI